MDDTVHHPFKMSIFYFDLYFSAWNCTPPHLSVFAPPAFVLSGISHIPVSCHETGCGACVDSWPSEVPALSRILNYTSYPLPATSQQNIVSLSPPPRLSLLCPLWAPRFWQHFLDSGGQTEVLAWFSSPAEPAGLGLFPAGPFGDPSSPGPGGRCSKLFLALQRACLCPE